ncbi:hypothetical protein [Halalkalibacter akibai]|uniref:hypothetical protein n=1 Tax=Halalkalibacter akibai TaxID=1411 RepID=UPI0005542C8C|nr:hypothetical protein [Halalkalibacter akibai]
MSVCKKVVRPSALLCAIIQHWRWLLSLRAFFEKIAQSRLKIVAAVQLIASANKKREVRSLCLAMCDHSALALASLAARLSEKFAQKGLKPCSGSAQRFSKLKKGSSPFLNLLLAFNLF